MTPRSVVLFSKTETTANLISVVKIHPTEEGVGHSKVPVFCSGFVDCDDDDDDDDIGRRRDDMEGKGRRNVKIRCVYV